MSKNITSQVLRLVLKSYSQSNSLNRGPFQNTSYAVQRTYVDFGNLFDKLKKNLSDIIENKSDNQDKQNQNISKDKHGNKVDCQENKTFDGTNLLRSVENVEPNLKYQTKVNVEQIQLPQDILVLFESRPELKENFRDAIINYNMMLEAGLDDFLIKENVDLLKDNPDELKQKLNLILQFGLDLKDTILFGHLSLVDLESFLKACKKDSIKPEDKIKFFCELFQEETYNVIMYLCECKQLRNQRLKFMSAKLEVFLDEGYTISDIMNNKTVLYYGLEAIRSKIAIIKEINSEKKSLSLMHKSSSELESLRSNKKREDSLKQKESEAIECLVEKIKCDKIIASRLVSRLKNKNAKKMKQVFELLEESNVDLKQLLIQPQVLNCRVESLTRRLDQMKDMDFNDYNKVALLLKTEKEFEESLQKISSYG